MRYTITSQQLDHFRKEGHIEFETLFSKEEATTLKTLLDVASEKNPSGRDLERENTPLIKAMKLSRLGQVAASLFDEKRVLLAFSQFQSPFKDSVPFEDLSSVTETLGCALFDFSSEEIVFYDRQFLIDFTKFEGPVFIVAFAKEGARYKLQEKDPHTHLLKQIGYASGDRLRSDTHPLISK